MLLTDIILPMTAGIIIFLFGMKVMEWALHRWMGARLRSVLDRFTTTPLRGLLTGTVCTAVLQSSTALTVITIGLVNAGAMSFAKSLGIILGTNIGTCLTTELLSLDLGQYAIPLLIGSTFAWMLSFAWPYYDRDPDRSLGYREHGPGKDQELDPLPPDNGPKAELRPDAWPVKPANAPQPPGSSAGWMYSLRWMALSVAGFACILVGMKIMLSISPALEERGLLAWFLEHAGRNALWGMLAGAAFTALVHSSAACIAMAMGLAASGSLSVELGIAIIIGANVGTCVTAVIAGFSGGRAGRWVAWFHVLLNVFGALLFYPFIDELGNLAAWMAREPDTQLARAQTLFNILCSLAVLPLLYLPLHRLWKGKAQPL